MLAPAGLVPVGSLFHDARDQIVSSPSIEA